MSNVIAKGPTNGPRISLFSGNANPELARRIAEVLGVPLGQAKVGQFSDGEINVEIQENIRGSSVYLIQSTSPPANQNLMELLIMMDAVKRASATNITAVIPYYGYARQDRKVAARQPITARLVADLLTVAGARRVVSVDLHSGQIQGFFNIPFDNLYASPVLIKHLRETHRPEDDLVIVSPDAGGVERARSYAKRLDAALAIIDKRRNQPNESQVMNVIGNVKGKTAILVDDMIDTAGTIANAAAALEAEGARSIEAVCTHALLSGPAIQRLSASPIHRILTTDTIPLAEEARRQARVEVVSIAPLLAEAIHRIHENASVSSLFN